VNLRLSTQQQCTCLVNRVSHACTTIIWCLFVSFVLDSDSAELAPAGNLLVSGIVAELDKVHAAGLLELGIASLPDEAFLAAMQRLAAAKPPRPLQLTAQPRKPRSATAVKPGRVRLASIAITLQGWDLSYRTASAVLPDHSSRLHGTLLQVQHRLALHSVSAELLLPEKTITAHVAQVAVSQEQQQHTAAESGAGITSTAAAAEAHVCQLLHIVSVSAGVLPPGHAAVRQSAADAEAPAGSTGSFGEGGAAASSNSGCAAGSAIDLDVSGVSVEFEPDVAFGAIDTVGELAGITEQAKQQLSQHWQQRLNQHRGQKAANDSPVPDLQKAGAKLCMALRLHNLAANMAVTPDVCFAVKVSNYRSNHGIARHQTDLTRCPTFSNRSMPLPICAGGRCGTPPGVPGSGSLGTGGAAQWAGRCDGAAASCCCSDGLGLRALCPDYTARSQQHQLPSSLKAAGSQGRQQQQLGKHGRRQQEQAVAHNPASRRS
jgi:hypothetical protein